MAEAVRMSPAVAETTTAAIIAQVARSGSHWRTSSACQLGDWFRGRLGRRCSGGAGLADRSMVGGVVGIGRAAGDESHAGSDEDDAQPAQRRNVFMQPELRQQRHDDIAQRTRGQHIGQVGPGKRGQVRSKKSDEQHDARSDPRRENSVDELAWVGERNGPKRLHAAGKKSIAAGSGEGDDRQHQVAAEGQWNGWSCKRLRSRLAKGR